MVKLLLIARRGESAYGFSLVRREDAYIRSVCPTSTDIAVS